MSLKPPLPPNTILDYRHVYDEGTALGTEDGINFTGAGVTVTDDSVNRRLNVTIPGGTVGAGGEPYTAVDSLSATPRSVTDWGTLINAAIVSGTRRFLFGAFDYPFTTMIDGRQLQGIIFEGAAGLDWYEPGRTDSFGKETGHTRLIWGGTGSGFALDMSSLTTGQNGNTGFCMSDIALLYSSSSYTGNLVNCVNGGFSAINRCFFGASSGSAAASSPSAVAAFRLNAVNTIDFQDCTFGTEWTSAAVRAREAAGGYSNVVHFNTCTFEGKAICNPGLDWVLDHCVFELQQAGAPAITTDFSYTAGGSGDQIQLTLRNCAYWDSANAANTVVSAPSGTFWEFSAVDCMDHCATGAIAKLYDFQGTGNIRIRGGTSSNIIDVGNGAVAASQKGIVSITAFDSTHTTLATRVQNVNTGHNFVEVGGSPGIANTSGMSGQVATVGHERVQYVDRPAIAAHTGVLNQTQQIIGTDLVGFVLITNSAGVAGPTGDLVDITLAAPAVSQATFGVGTGFQMPCVEVFPFKPDDSGNVFATPSTAHYFNCQAYAHSKSVRAGGSQGSFSIGVNVGIPSGQILCVGYRVIHL